MKEQLINFETAQSAKEKGFNIPVSMVYYVPSKTLLLAFSAIESNDIYYSAPTQSLLQKWLREEHKIIVSINIMSDLSYYSLLIDINENKLNLRNQSKNRGFDTYELALEDGLQEALKLI